MGLQSRGAPSTPALSAMACLDVETPSICRGKFKSALKAPATFHERIRSLERARTGSFLKHKLCSRPQRSELVRMRILQETQAEPSLKATQMKLKRARLADDLNEKLAQRPGPLELVEKNILPVDSASEDAPDEDEARRPDPADVYSFNEDSSEATSPHLRHSSASASPGESRENDAASASPKISSSTQRSPSPSSRSASDAASLVSASEQPRKAPAPHPTATAPCGSVLVKQSLSKLPGDKSRSKRSKEPKPRVKKLKYHQYIPPDRKQEPSEAPMDSAYARLLQQQQQFLQLQILTQQQFNFQPSPASSSKPAAEAQASCSSIVLAGAASSHVQPLQAQISCRPDHLPANLDEMKVAELKMELKLRSLPVSGTKTDLIERLKLYQETSTLQTAAAAAAAAEKTEAPQPENAKFSPPVSPIASRVSNLGIEDRGAADGPAELADQASSAHAAGSVLGESPADKRTPDKDSEKDKRLHEKERQIEELMRKLEQEQRLVEELKMQLEVEKRSLHADSPPLFSPLQVKDENSGPSGCCGSPVPPVSIKQEWTEDPCTPGLPEPEKPAGAGARARILLAAPLPAAAVAIQLPTSSIILQGPDDGVGMGLLPAPAQIPRNAEASQQHRSSQANGWRVDSAPPTFHNPDPANVSPRSSRPAFMQPKFPNQASKSKDPPCYEDAVKQRRTLQPSVQGPTPASQHMDDLFDVLIESGEISPFVRQDARCEEAPLPVTASVTTLPINTVLSRPPALVQVAQPPAVLPSQPLLARTDSPTVTMEMDESTLPSSLNLHGDNMDWLDLNLSAAGVGSLDVVAPVGVFSDFLDSHELQLNWD